MTVAFAIPVKQPATRQEAEILDILLSLTLDSLAQQTCDDFLAVVCGHTAPQRALERHPATVWLQAPFAPPADASEGRQDKHRKRAHIAAYLRDHAPLFVMNLDGDDLVHRDLVAFTLAPGEHSGVLLDQGLALNFRTGELAPIPGVWNQSFNSVCGSSAVIRYEKSELPRGADDSHIRFFDATQSHTRVLDVTIKRGRPLTPFPGPGAVYVLNNGINLSYDLLVGRRSARIERNTRRRALPEPLEALRPFVDPERYLAARDAVSLTY